MALAGALLGLLTGATLRQVGPQVYEFLAISNPHKMSLASKRAVERHYDQGPEWYREFRLHDLKGDLAYEEGVIRRDPSAVLRCGDTDYVWH